MARAASAARRLRSSEWTRLWQDGQASRTGAICVPQCGQPRGARPWTSATIGDELGRRAGRGLVRSGDLERDTPVELPRLIQREAGDQQVDRTRNADHDGGRVREHDDQPESDGDRERSRQMRSPRDRKSTRLNSSHMSISYAVFCLKKKNKKS